MGGLFGCHQGIGLYSSPPRSSNVFLAKVVNAENAEAAPGALGDLWDFPSFVKSDPKDRPSGPPNHFMNYMFDLHASRLNGNAAEDVTATPPLPRVAFAPARAIPYGGLTAVRGDWGVAVFSLPEGI